MLKSIFHWYCKNRWR